MNGKDTVHDFDSGVRDMNLDIRKTEHPDLKLSDVRVKVRRCSDVSIDLEFIRKKDNVIVNRVQLMLLGNHCSQRNRQEIIAYCRK